MNPRLELKTHITIDGNSEAHKRIQAFSSKPDIKKICRNQNNATRVLSFLFALGNIVIFYKKKIGLCYFVMGLLAFFQ